MKAVLFSIGTRGDTEPFLAIAELLKARKWDVLCVFPEQFRDTVNKAGFRFEGFSEEFLNLLDSHEAKMVMGGAGSWWSRLKFIKRMAGNSMKIQKEIIEMHHRIQLDEKPDRVLYHPKCMHALSWGIANPQKSILISPIPCMTHSVKHLTAIGLKGNSDKGPLINQLSYWLINWMKVLMTYKMCKKYYKDFPQVKLTRRKLYHTMVNTERTFYTISPSLFPRPDYWPAAAQVVGYFERNKTLNWTPDDTLSNFINTHNKILFISFGSMVNPEPQTKTKYILEIIKRHAIPTIINTSWGGLEKPEQAPDHTLFVENIPYDWIFPKVYGVIHHGGSGTTHTGLKYGCATMIVPHIIDQFYWNDTLSALKLGPKGPAIQKLDAENFEKSLLDLWNNVQYKNNAIEMSRKMKVESNEEKLYELIKS